MSIESLCVRDVTILTDTPIVDRYNNQVPDWTSPTSVVVKGWLSQTNAIETLDHRDLLVTETVLTLPAFTPITAQNRVQVDGTTYEVDGEPHRAWTPRGEHHVEVRLREVTG